jgi:hypothetical protein
MKQVDKKMDQCDLPIMHSRLRFETNTSVIRSTSAYHLVVTFCICLGPLVVWKNEELSREEILPQL